MPIELSIIAPFYNEEDNITAFCFRTTAVLAEMQVSYELILIDDGSRDNTLQAMEKAASQNEHIHYISFTRNFGHQAALFAGINAASGNHMVLIDGDLQDPPELIKALYEKQLKGYDLVYAKRKSRSGESFLKKVTAVFFYRLMRNITSIKIPVDTGDFRIFNRQVARELMCMNDKRKFLRGQMSWLGFKEGSVEFDRVGRKNGTTGFGYTKMIRFAFDGITGFSDFPLKFASISGMVMSVISFFMIIYVLLAKFVWGATITGWTSIMVTILFLGGIQLLSIGIIGEYVGRINEQVRNRQLYVVKKTNLPS